MQDETGTSVEAKLRDDVEKLHNLQGTLDLIHQTQKDIMAVQNHCFRKIGFVKYNAFDNIGNNLSFAFTVLDGKMTDSVFPVCMAAMNPVFCKTNCRRKVSLWHE